MCLCQQKEQTNINANLIYNNAKEKEPKSLESNNKNIVQDNKEIESKKKIYKIIQIEKKEFKPIYLISSVKSSYIIRYIFSFLDEKQRLKMIIYNKTIQKNIFEINIDFYKIVSGKFKISKENGKGEEYKLNTNILIFQGNYLKGKRNGKGKEYYENGKLKFEGDYLNNFPITGKGYNSDGKTNFEILNNKAKEYYQNRKLKFEGEYFNGKRWNGKGFNINGNLEYEIIKGRGKVKEFDELGHLLLEGEYVNGKKNGKVKEYYLYGRLKFEGIYSNNYPLAGKGYDSNGNINYEIKNEKIKEYYKDGKLKFEGEYLKGEKNGKGTEYYSNGNIKLEGEYLLGSINGKVKEFYGDKKLKFEGEYLNNYKITGKGYDLYGDIIYEIENGKIKEYNYYYNGKSKFEGEYLNGKKTGKGKKYIFEDNKLVKEIEYDSWKPIKVKFIDGQYEDISTDPKLKYFKCYKNGKLYYEGNIKYDKKSFSKYRHKYRHGKGKQYDENNNLIFDGEYSHGKKQKGTENIYYRNSKLTLEWDMINGKRKLKNKIFKSK